MRSIPPLSGTDSEINHSDPPCTALRSGEHDSSTAYTMIENFVHLLESKKFDEVVIAVLLLLVRVLLNILTMRSLLFNKSICDFVQFHIFAPIVC